MVINKRIAVDLANRFPASFIVMSHSMNVQTFNVVIALYNEGEALSIDSGATVTATLVSGGYLVCTDRACTYDNNEITVDITNEVGHTSNIPAGELQIEICVKSGNTELYIPYISAYISKSIQDDAAVTPTSYGTVAAAVAEVAAARGGESSLLAALNKKMVYGSISTSTITTLNAVQYCYGKYSYRLYFYGDAAEYFGGGYGIMNVIPHPAATGCIREITMSNIAGIKFRQTVTYAGNNSYTYSAWAEIRTDDLPTISKVTVWDMQTSQNNNFTVPTSYAGKIGDMVFVTNGSGNGGALFMCIKTVSAYGSTTYNWQRIDNKIAAEIGSVIEDYIHTDAVTESKVKNGAISFYKLSSSVQTRIVYLENTATTYGTRIATLENTATSHGSRITALESTIGNIVTDMQRVLTGGV